MKCVPTFRTFLLKRIKAALFLFSEVKPIPWILAGFHHNWIVNHLMGIISMHVGNTNKWRSREDCHLFILASNNSSYNFISTSYRKFLFNLITSLKILLMCFTFKKNNKRTKKPVNRFLQNGAGAVIRSP